MDKPNKSEELEYFINHLTGDIFNGIDDFANEMLDYRAGSEVITLCYKAREAVGELREYLKEMYITAGREETAEGANHV
jgi:hypothetical protein